MAKSMGVESGVGRISALSDDLLCHILSFVPTKVAVCPSVLSARWRFLYTLVPSLDFVTDTDGDADDVEKANRFVKFVERVLLFRTRSVERFGLKFYHDIDPLHMDGWMRALMLRNIQELDLYNALKTPSYPGQLPASLFSCKTLAALKLNNSYFCKKLEVPTKVSLPNLKVLHIRNTIISCYDVERLLSSCPVLDDLVLYVRIDEFGINHLLNISNASLKRLRLEQTIFFQEDRTPQIMINCPALVYLDIYMCEEYFVVLVAAESLAEVVIDGIIQYLPNYVNARDVLREIKNTQSLRFPYDIIQGFYHQSLPLPRFNKLTYLEVSYYVCLFDSRCLQYLLDRCVVLETLVFKRQQTKEYSTAQSTRTQFLLEQSRLADLLCHLKTIEFKLYQIEDAEGEALMKIIEFFLINAKVLEKLSVRVRVFPDTQQLKFLSEVTTIPRVSKKCQVFVDKLR